jgi:hypothetical protein
MEDPFSRMSEKRRYQVFVSSTFVDLKEERAAGQSALQRAVRLRGSREGLLDLFRGEDRPALG